jgi:hypothetical protein
MENYQCSNYTCRPVESRYVRNRIHSGDNSFQIMNFDIKHLGSIICGDLWPKLMIPIGAQRGRGTQASMFLTADREEGGIEENDYSLASYPGQATY